ncbi:tricin synthase 2-like isoform X2 [Miscanthus floridulus]|uniref:tricin synthase 2-like isoform X2 n=1 Tax=Miscanthus floridulus TaxID=154761 RepID=UPI00345A1C63
MAAASDGGGGGSSEVKNIHSKESTKTLLKSEALYEYMLNTMVYPREHECLRELRLITQQHTYSMCTGLVQMKHLGEQRTFLSSSKLLNLFELWLASGWMIN